MERLAQRATEGLPRKKDPKESAQPLTLDPDRARSAVRVRLLGWKGKSPLARTVATRGYIAATRR